MILSSYILEVIEVTYLPAIRLLQDISSILLVNDSRDYVAFLHSKIALLGHRDLTGNIKYCYALTQSTYSFRKLY